MDSVVAFDNFVTSYKKSCEDIIQKLKDDDEQVRKFLSDFAINHIIGFGRNTDSLSACINAILFISSYLNHDSEKVRNIAANILCDLIEKACQFLSHETDPTLIKKYGKMLLNIIKKIETLASKGLISLDICSKISLDIAKGILKGLGIKDQETDEFVDSNLQDHATKIFSNLFCDNFVRENEKGCATASPY